VPTVEDHFRYVDMMGRKNVPLTCRCSGTGRGFGGFTTCQWGYRAKTVDMLQGLLELRDGLREVELLDDANS
jgi:hypothetical protein